MRCISPLDFLSTGVTVSCSALPPAVRRESNHRKRLSELAAQQEMCERERFNERTRAVHADGHLRGRVHGRVRISTLLLILACVCGRVRDRGQRGRVRKRTPRP